MKIALFSDIHGNDIAFEAAVQDAKNRGAEKFIIAGDLISDYPLASQVIERSKELTPYVVRGNRENYYEKYHTGEDLHWKDYKQFSPALWSYSHMAKTDFEYIFTLPEQLTVPLDNQTSILVTHYIRDIENFITDRPERIFACGHVHKSCIKWVSDKLYINAGSVGGSCINDFTAEYALLDYSEGHMVAEMIYAPYNRRLLEELLAEKGFDQNETVENWFRLLIKSQEDGINYISELFKTSEKLKAECGYTCYDTPDDIWDKVIALFKDRGIL